MANLNAPSGLSPVMYRNGNFWNGQARIYAVAPSDTNPYFIGDVVKMVAGSADANGIGVVTLATAGASVRGVIIGVSGAVPMGGVLQGGPVINPANLVTVSRPAAAQSTYWYVTVVDDPDVIFEIQEVYSGTAGAVTAVTKNANFVYAAPSATSNLSGTTLDNTTFATTATLNLKIVSAAQRTDNVPFTLGQRWWVCMNNHDFSGGTVGY